MKQLLMVLLILVLNCLAYGQDYQLNFAASGESSTVDSVIIQNLSQCTSLTIGGSDILNLSSETGIHMIESDPANEVSVYPNPSPGDYSLSISSASPRNLNISIFSISGKLLFSQQKNINRGFQQLKVCGIPEGIYLLHVRSDKFYYTAKLVSDASAGGTAGISVDGQNEKISFYQPSSEAGGITCSKTYKSVITMRFHAGDTLKLTGISGHFRTIMMLFPTCSQTVTFNFVDCTDADSNHYAVVQVGSQLWMAENLKTTRYRDGSLIPNVTDSAGWGSLSSGAYCNFHNDTLEGQKYGRLYNFYAVADPRNICPPGWHVASNPEWNSMEIFLDPTVDTTAWMGRGRRIGRILKEGCSSRWQYMDTTWGLNSAGFTALCSNFRNNMGAWSLAPDNNHDDAFWTSTAYTANTAWGLSLRWCYSDIYAIPLINMRSGSSVRCIRDEE